MYVTWGKSPRFHPDPCRQHGRPSRHDPEPCHSYGHEHRPAARVSALHRVQRSAPPFGEGGALRVHCDQPVTSAGSTWCCSATVARCRCGAGRSLPLVTVDGGGTGASARPTTTSIPHSRSAPTSSVKSFNAVRGVTALTATSKRRAALTRLVRYRPECTITAHTAEVTDTSSAATSAPPHGVPGSSRIQRTAALSLPAAIRDCIGEAACSSTRTGSLAG